MNNEQLQRKIASEFKVLDAGATVDQIKVVLLRLIDYVTDNHQQGKPVFELVFPSNSPVLKNTVIAVQGLVARMPLVNFDLKEDEGVFYLAIIIGN